MPTYYAVKKMGNGTQDLPRICGSAFTNITKAKRDAHPTKRRGLFELIYYEAYKNKTDARSREIQLKSGQGKAYLRQRIKRFLTLSG